MLQNLRHDNGGTVNHRGRLGLCGPWFGGYWAHHLGEKMHLDYNLTKYIPKLIYCKTKLHLDHHLIIYAKIKIIVKTSKIKNLVFIEPLHEKSFLN